MSLSLARLFGSFNENFARTSLAKDQRLKATTAIRSGGSFSTCQSLGQIGSQLHATQAQRVADHGHRTQAHGSVWLTQDINAAIAGAREAGAAQFVVNDGHGGRPHILLEQLDADGVTYEMPKSPRDYMPGLDTTFAGVLIIGAHAKAGTRDAFLDHTQAPLGIFDYQVNGRSIGEIVQVAMIAGHYRVPVLMVSGDQAACREARSFLRNVRIAAVKESLGRQRARCLPLSVSQERIREAAQQAVHSRKRSRPYRVRLPAAVQITFQRTDIADQHTAPHLTRTDGRTIRFQIRDLRDVLRV